MSAGRSFLTAFTADLIALELPEADEELAAATCAWVVARVDGASQLTCLGLTLVGTLFAAGVRASTGHAYGSLPTGRRRSVARRLVASQLPIVRDYARAIRALAVSRIYEELGTRPREH